NRLAAIAGFIQRSKGKNNYYCFIYLLSPTVQELCCVAFRARLVRYAHGLAGMGRFIGLFQSPLFIGKSA
ncbi:hypothetical protein KQS67_17865, partial [Proteus mirabilis]|uniref:hypothetical protein n=1 Tax=Proteus mirabilis TaxID=584 RepID=UPI001C1E264F